MKSIYPYLSFNGNCRKAMTFYQKCLGGELTFQTIGESPFSEKMPQRMKNCILHSELKNDKLLLFGSDLVNDIGLLKGNTVSLVLNCKNEREIRICYKKLSSGGAPTDPLETTLRGYLFGGLTDKFGNNWLLHCECGEN